MATYKTVTVKSSGGDYATLNAVDAGEATDLTATAGDLVVECYNFEDTTQALFDDAGWVTDSTHRLVIRAVDGHGGKWNTSCYRMVGATGRIVNQTIDYLFIDGVQCNLTNAGSNAQGYYAHSSLDAVGETEIDRMIVVGVTGATAPDGITNSEPLHDIKIRNSVLYGLQNGIASAGTGSRIIADNVTVDDCINGITPGYAGHILTNCRITNCTNVVSATTSDLDAASNYNLTDGTAPANWGANSIDSTDTPTVDYLDSSNATLTARDYHLASTSDSGYNTGTDLSGSFTTDIDSDTRSSWDIGADEYGTGAATINSADATHAHTADNVTLATLNLPTDLTAVSASLSSIDISWTDTNSGTKQYRVYWHADGDTLWNLDGQVAAGSTSYTIEWLAEGSYVIGISAFDATEETAMATVQGMTVVTLLPAESTHAHTADNVSVFDEDVFTPPSGLVLTVTADRIDATWTDTNAGSFPYRVYYLRTGLDSVFTFDSETSAGAESASVKYLATGTEYTIKVAPYDTPTLGPGAQDDATTGSVLRFSAR